MTWPFGDLPMFDARFIYADPPWKFSLRSARGIRKSPEHHYDCMELDAIKALPVGSLVRSPCMLWMWATAPMLDQAFQVIEAWGFKYCTAGAWAKQSKTGARWNLGTGYRLRSTAEFFLLATIGEPAQRARDVRNLIVSPIREHSRKPDVYDMIERAWDGPYLELFARNTRPGWSSWGNQVTKFDGGNDDGDGDRDGGVAAGISEGRGRGSVAAMAGDRRGDGGSDGPAFVPTAAARSDVRGGVGADCLRVGAVRAHEDDGGGRDCRRGGRGRDLFGGERGEDDA